MATVRFFAPLSMAPGSGGDSGPVKVLYADTSLVVIRTGAHFTEYYGNFTYSLTGEWHGTVEGFDTYRHNVPESSTQGIHVNARYFTHGTQDQLLRAAFGEDDSFTGSSGGDLIVSYAGDDTVRGMAGNDGLYGRDGADSLDGGRGHDLLNGGEGNDTLDGGSGNDRLIGAGGRDIFVFDGTSGRNLISDFANHADRIRIDSGAHAFGDLEITREGNDVHIAFADTEIVLHDTWIGAIGAEDFLF